MKRNPEDFIVVPRESLSNEALQGLIDEFIQREGTDYGHAEFSFEEKRSMALKQLSSGHAKIVFSIRSGNCTLLPTQVVAKCTIEGNNGIKL